jgi:hypothetical protein
LFWDSFNSRHQKANYEKVPKPKSVRAYIAAAPKEVQSKLKEASSSD